MEQSGGSNTVGYLSIRANSQYSFTGGTLAIANGGLNIDGTLNMGNNPVTIAAGDNTVINLAKGTFQGYSKLTLNVGANSLTIIPDGFDPTTAFAGFGSAGFVHELGSDLVVPAGQGFAGSGTIDDRVACEGTIAATPGRVLALRKGLSVSNGGSVNLGGRSSDSEAAAGTLTVNDNSSGVNNGQLTAAVEYIGTGSNTAVQFTHVNGSNTVLENLYLAYDAPSKAVYELARTGALTAPVEWIGYNGIGQFRQSGGSNTVEYLHVGGGSRYTYTGGTLQVTDNGGIELKGTLDFSGAAMTVNVGDNTLVDLSGSVENSALASLNVGANSLTIFANGFDPGTSLASFTTGGMTHTAGTELVVASGEGFTVCGAIADHVRSEGTIGVPAGRGLALNDGLTLNGGSVALGEYSSRDKRGVLTVNDTVSGISAGQLTAVYQYVGVNRTGRFTQTAGSNTLQYDLTLGSSASVQGTYDLSGTSQLSAHSEYIGKNSTGRFIQSGGSNTVASFLCLGKGGGGNGTYELSGGTLTAGTEHLGETNAVGHFVQTGGTHTVNGSLSVGEGEALESTYELSGDSSQLFADMVFVGYDRSIGRFVQTGGTHTVDDLYIAGGSSAIGSYDLAAGTLSAYREEVGDSYYKSSARFNQTGGTNTTTYLNIYQGRVYTLGGGSLTTKYLTIEGGVDLPATLDLANPAAILTVSNTLSFQPGTVIKAAAGATIHMTGSTFENESTNPAALAGLESLGLVFEGGTQDVDNFEVAGQNLGAIPAGFKTNFALGRLTLGGADIGKIKLVDAIDNQPGSVGKESLYVWDLAVGNGSSLDLGGLNLYYRAGSIAPGATIVANGGNLVPVTVYDGDLDLNGKVDIFDVAVLQAKYGMTQGATWADGDFDHNGTVDIFDVARLQVNYGAGVASAPSPVPEPATITLALVGLAAVLALARRRCWSSGSSRSLS
ncbi:MAG: PEP-CTERM sorting domain-containing protein [Pirellulales bacterium]